MKDAVLVFNAGSSSIKLTLFDMDLADRLQCAVDAIGGTSRLHIGSEMRRLDIPDHVTALEVVFAALEERGVTIGTLRAVGHRVVHGGSRLTAPQRLTPEIRAEIEACVPLAPLHNPVNLVAIDMLAKLAPHVPQYASFDTAFHATNPELATRYALPPEYGERGIRRYGFHGLSYSALVRNLPALSGQALPQRLLACHLGNGASLCAIRDGKSVATTMGYSPVEGLTMGTRIGNIDANAVLRLVEEDGLEATRRLLNQRTGLLGLSGLSADMRALSQNNSSDSDLAIKHFCYWAARNAGSMIVAMGGCDAIAFTGGIGENAPGIRADILERFGWLGVRIDPELNSRGGSRLHAESSRITAWVVPADEEREIAKDTIRLLL